MRHTAYIGLGSNLDNPLEQIKAAINELDSDKAISVEKISRLYKSKPLEIKNANSEQNQADFINAVVRVKTNYTPIELLDSLQTLELNHNRLKEYRWGPRSLDLDILMFDDMVLQTERLTIPHSELVNRDFVLYPLNDIAADLVIPKQGKLKELLLNVPSNDLIIIEK